MNHLTQIRQHLEAIKQQYRTLRTAEDFIRFSAFAESHAEFALSELRWIEQPIVVSECDGAQEWEVC